MLNTCNTSIDSIPIINNIKDLHFRIYDDYIMHTREVRKCNERRLSSRSGRGVRPCVKMSEYKTETSGYTIFTQSCIIFKILMNIADNLLKSGIYINKLDSIVIEWIISDVSQMKYFSKNFSTIEKLSDDVENVDNNFVHYQKIKLI